MKARRAIPIVLAIVVLLPLVVVGVLVLVVQSESGERWLERQVSGRIHREVQVEDIKVRWEWPPALAFGRIRIANPDWARTPDLIDGRDVYARFEFQPLLDRRLVLSFLRAREARLG